MKYRIKKQWRPVANSYEFMPQIRTIFSWKNLMYPSGATSAEYAQSIIDRHFNG
jgi:hypothetical protein